MAWVEKYNLEFSDIKNRGWVTKIYQQDVSVVSTTLIGAGNPILFEYTNESDDLFDTFKEVKATLSIVSMTNLAFSDLYSYEPKTFLVKIWQTGDDWIHGSGELFYQGYVDTQNYSESYDDAPVIVNIGCNTGLELLRNIEYKDASGNYYNGRKYE